MNFVREITNLGTHGGEIVGEDASRVLQDIVLITEWYVANYNLYSKSNIELSQSAEILPELQETFPNYLRPDITSVKLGQLKTGVTLKSQALKKVELSDETIKRTDLGFISDLEFIANDEYEEVLYFSLKEFI